MMLKLVSRKHGYMLVNYDVHRKQINEKVIASIFTVFCYTLKPEGV